jgi:GTP cyclohydrolase I
MYEWLLSGTGSDPASAIDAVFEADHEDPVVLSNITFYSLCEHHLLPFYGTAQIAYIPNGKISGISKLARALEVASRRLQVQERLTGQVADAIFSALNPHGVAVELQAEHMCMSMRGIQKPGSRVITTAIRGHFKNSGLGEEGLLALLHRR